MTKKRDIVLVSGISGGVGGIPVTLDALKNRFRISRCATQSRHRPKKIFLCILCPVTHLFFFL